MIVTRLLPVRFWFCQKRVDILLDLRAESIWLKSDGRSRTDDESPERRQKLGMAFVMSGQEE
jgi:hypothetical protein